MSGGGFGRGKRILAQQDEQAKSALNSTKSSSENKTTGDSGFGPSAATSSGEPQRVGRGRLLQQLLQPTLGGGGGGDSLPVSRGRGRAAIIETLLGGKSTASESVLPGVSRGVSRGQLLQSTSRSSEVTKTTPSRASGSDSSGQGMEKITERVSNVQIDLPAPQEEAFSEDVLPQNPILKHGNFGDQVPVVSNYIQLKQRDANMGVYEYEVRFCPTIDSRSVRFQLLNEHSAKFGGTKTFDGVILYLPILLPDKLTTYVSQNPADGSQLEIRIMYKRKKELRDCINLYNILFDRILNTLKYVRFKRKQFDPSAPKVIPQHKLEIWPGYVTAVDEYEGGLMLCCDVSHRLICQKSALEVLQEAYKSNPSQYQETAKKALLGSVVLARYNNKTYRIDDISFDMNPMSTFNARQSEVTYYDYYLSHHNIEIRDKRQPLLISIKQRRVSNKAEPEDLIFGLIPELCYLTGLRDDLRSDFHVMREIATHTRVSPNQRVMALEKFCKNVNGNPAARKILEDWGLQLANTPQQMMARQFEEEQIFFAKNKVSAGLNADFGKFATSNQLIDVVHLRQWLLIHCQNDSRVARTFMEFLERNSSPMGVKIQRPTVIALQSDRIEAYVSALRENIRKGVQIVVCICPNSRDDRYAAIKKICCAELPVPSQVINARTLCNDSKNRSIVQKIALQMNCKMGGTLWSLFIPMKNTMICGIDSYHDPSGKNNSTAAFVASINQKFTRWYSKAVVQTSREEIVNGLCASLINALKVYERENNCLPEKIIIFRDGVGIGQFNVVENYEIPQFDSACQLGFKNYKAQITFIVVQKRIRTRFFNAERDLTNPLPGTVLDHTVTQRYLYDFFLVSQMVRQGTVTPTHYVVLRDDSNFTPDILQRLSYKLCFMYYNWPGTVRVPACCQYAHKLASLVGESLRRCNAEELADKLFYL